LTNFQIVILLSCKWLTSKPKNTQFEKFGLLVNSTSFYIGINKKPVKEKLGG